MRLAGQVRWRICKQCRCWVMFADPNGVDVLLDPDAIPSLAAARRLLVGQAHWVYSIENDYAHPVSREALADLVTSGSPARLHVDHEHQSGVALPDPAKRKQRVVEAPDEPPF